MKNIRRWISLGLVVMLSTSILAGCTSTGEQGAESKTESSTEAGAGDGESAENTESGAEVSNNPLRPDTLDTITVVLFGEESPRMQELMENEFQQIFIDEINTKVELLYLPWTENGAGGKVDLMIASGQEFDAAIIDPVWAASSVSKGYLQDLSEVIEMYLPDWNEVMQADVCFEPYTFDGGIYAIPIGNKPSGGVYNTICVRQDIIDEIGMDNIETLEDIDEYVTKAKEIYPNMYATYDISTSAYLVRAASDRNITMIHESLWVDQDTNELISFAETEEFKTVANLYHDWYQRDLIPRDFLTNTITLPFQAGLTFFFRGTCGTTVIENEPSLKEVIPTAYTQEYYTSPDKPIYKGSYENTAFQVPVSSTKADRVALFVNLLQKNTELANAFIYGVEGVDYEYKNDKIVSYQSDELFYQWMIFNVEISTFDETFPDDFIETYRNWDDEALPSVTFGFAIDYENVKTEKAQIDAVWEELAYPILAGFVDYDSNIDKLLTALDKAGWDTYIAEIQRQFDEHLSK